MDFNLSLPIAFLNSHLGSQRLFQRVDRSFDVRIDNSAASFRTIRSAAGIACDEHLRLADGVISLNDLSGGVEYRIEVR